MPPPASSDPLPSAVLFEKLCARLLVDVPLGHRRSFAGLCDVPLLLDLLHSGAMALREEPNVLVLPQASRKAGYRLAVPTYVVGDLGGSLWRLQQVLLVAGFLQVPAEGTTANGVPERVWDRWSSDGDTDDDGDVCGRAHTWKTAVEVVFNGNRLNPTFSDRILFLADPLLEFVDRNQTGGGAEAHHRGAWEVLLLLMALKACFPTRVLLVRGRFNGDTAAAVARGLHRHLCSIAAGWDGVAQSVVAAVMASLDCAPLAVIAGKTALCGQGSAEPGQCESACAGSLRDWVFADRFGSGPRPTFPGAPLLLHRVGGGGAALSAFMTNSGLQTLVTVTSRDDTGAVPIKSTEKGALTCASASHSVQNVVLLHLARGDLSYHSTWASPLEGIACGNWTQLPCAATAAFAQELTAVGLRASSEELVLLRVEEGAALSAFRLQHLPEDTMTPLRRVATSVASAVSPVIEDATSMQSAQQQPLLNCYGGDRRFSRSRSLADEAASSSIGRAGSVRAPLGKETRDELMRQITALGRTAGLFRVLKRENERLAVLRDLLGEQPIPVSVLASGPTGIEAMILAQRNRVTSQ